MKKIAILTLPLVDNYGCFLQAYALQQVLKKQGFESKIIDKVSLPKRCSLLLFIAIVLKRFIFKYLLRKNVDQVIPFFINKAQRDIMTSNFGNFKQELLDKTEEIFTHKDLLKVFKKEGFNVCIVGSDQVWRPKYTYRIGTYFLDFLGNQEKVKRIAYAASFGVNNWEYSPVETKACSALAKKFDAISVRESSGIDLCCKYLNTKSKVVLDPTLLLSKSDYDILIDTQKENNQNGILTYILDKNIEKQLIVDGISEILKLPIFNIGREKSPKSVSDINDCIFPSISNWLIGYKNAKYVITDSFHGCVFSILFNIPFVVIANRKRGLDRLISLLKIFGLEDRLILEDFNLYNELIAKNIDWKYVNGIRNVKQKESIEFLLKNI